SAPYAVAMLPGARAPPTAELAAFKTPPGLIVGRPFPAWLICTDTPPIEKVAARVAPGLGKAVSLTLADSPVAAPEEKITQSGKPSTFQGQKDSARTISSRSPPAAVGRSNLGVTSLLQPVPPGTRTRILWLEVSATYTLPVLSRIMPAG